MTPACRTLRLLSRSTEATEALGARLGELLPAGSVLSLRGELGSGKTAFVRGVAEGLGIDPEAVSSPTYALQLEHRGRLVLHHFDAWISNRGALFAESGGDEVLLADGVCAIEWSEELAERLPAPRLELRFEHLGPEERGIELELVLPEPDSLRSVAPLEALEAALTGLAEFAAARGGEFEPAAEPSPPPDVGDPR